jgi:asparagine synthase (glutamine-hydrolysing)
MPGIVGFAADTLNRPAREILASMAVPLIYAPEQQPLGFESQWYSAAVVDYGAPFPFLKRSYAYRDGVLLLMEGEVFPDASAVPHECSSPNPTIQRAEYCLILYLREGPGFVRSLNGSFAMAIFDARDRQVHLYSDRVGTVPLYFWTGQRELAFGSSLRSLLLCRDSIGREYNRDAIAELMLFERVWGAKTLFKDIQRLTAGTHASWNGDRLLKTQYWTLPTPTNTPRARSLGEVARELYFRVQHSVEKRTADTADTMVLLSGGVDSRLLLACCPPETKAGTFTNSDHILSKETRTAIKVAKLLGRKHIFLQRELDHYATVAELAADVAEGMCTFAGFHALGLHQQIADAGVRAVLTGTFWDTLFKGFNSLPPINESTYRDEPESLKSQRVARHLANASVLRRVHHQDLLALALSDELKERGAVAKERIIRQMVARYPPGASPENFTELVGFSQVAFDTAMGLQHSLRVKVMDRSPTFDNDLFEIAYHTPVQLKKDGQILRRALSFAHPRLGWIPDANNGLPAGLCPPWLGAATWMRETPRNLARKLSAYSHTLARLRASSGTQVFEHAQSWHDINALLKCNDRYRSMVRVAIRDLDEDMFAKPMITHLFADDLTGRSPRLNKLFEMILTFGLFDKKWGPSASRTPMLNVRTGLTMLRPLLSSAATPNGSDTASVERPSLSAWSPPPRGSA